MIDEHLFKEKFRELSPTMKMVVYFYVRRSFITSETAFDKIKSSMMFENTKKILSMDNMGNFFSNDN